MINNLIGADLDALTSLLADKLAQRQASSKGDAIPFSLYMEKWLISKADEGLNKNTLQKYRYLWHDHIEPELGNLMLSAIDTDNLQALVGKCKETLSPATIREITSSILSPAFKEAHGRKLINSNPMLFIHAPRLKPTIKKRPLTMQEIQQLLSISNGHYLAITIPLLLFTGMRVGEMLALRWENVDFNARTIYICESYVSLMDGTCELHAPKTETSIRYVAIPAVLVNILKRHKLSQPPDHSYVVSQIKANKMIRPDNYRRQLRKWLKKCNIKGISPHSFRHTYISMCKEQHLDDMNIMQQAGHKDPRMILRYAHQQTNEGQYLVADTIGAAFDGLSIA